METCLLAATGPALQVASGEDVAAEEKQQGGGKKRDGEESGVVAGVDDGRPQCCVVSAAPGRATGAVRPNSSAARETHGRAAHGGGRVAL